MVSCTRQESLNNSLCCGKLLRENLIWSDCYFAKYGKDLSDHWAILIVSGYNPQQRTSLIFRWKCLCRDKHRRTVFLLESWGASRAFSRRGLWGGRRREEIDGHREAFQQFSEECANNAASIWVLQHSPQARQDRKSCLCIVAYLIFIFIFFPCSSRFYWVFAQF